jgi:hypothetical protein
MGYVSADYFERDMADLRKESQAAESEFRSALQGRAGSLEWRSTVEFGALSGHIAHEARSSDLIITSVESGGLFEASRLVNTGDLIMQVGRPVLVVPQGPKALALAQVLVAWKDTRETRRAVLDALPLLKKAARVTLAEIAVEDRLPLARKHLRKWRAGLDGMASRRRVGRSCRPARTRASSMLSPGSRALTLSSPALTDTVACANGCSAA